MNENIVISKLNENGYEDMLYVEFVPYNRVITLKYIRQQLKFLIRKYDDFVLYAQGFNFDGLYETNKGLIESGCCINDNITNESVYFEVVE